MKLRILAIALLGAALGFAAFANAQIDGIMQPRVNSVNGGAGGGGSAPTSTPTISAPTAVATAGNILTLSNLGSPSYTTHDLIACCIEQNDGIGKTLNSSVSTQAGWFYVESQTLSPFAATFLDLVAHCVQPNEQASYTFGSLTNSVATQKACALYRNTSCGQDSISATATNASSTTVNYPSSGSAVANDIALYCATWNVGVSNVSMSGNPAGLVVDATQQGIASTSDGIQLGHIPIAAATSIASTTGTLSGAQNSGSILGLIAPIH